MIETVYTVPDMSCGHCKAAIEDSLNDLSGVEKADAEPDAGTVEVVYDEIRVDGGRIKGAIENAGYTVAA